jgi:peptidoglycan-associated lipoprotein
MRRLGILLVLVLIAPVFMGLNCGGNPPPPQPEQPTVTPAPVDTTPTPPPPPPPPPKPKLQDSQFKTVYFDFDKFNLRPDAREALDYDANLLKEYPDAMVRLEGNADERGTVEYNLSLGEKRANSVRDYLIGLGISPNRLTTISYGEERPVDPAHNEAAWAKNRRVDFAIMSQ